MIYILEDTDCLDEGFLSESESLLSEQRKEKLKEYAVFSDKINGSAVYLLLRYGLKKEYHVTEKPDFIFRENGKPYIDGNIYFNLSHCKNTAVCILSDTDTAVDVMELRTIRSAVIKRTCTMTERQRLSQSDTPERDFIRLWTRKECYAKLKGKGLQLDFSKIGEDLPEMHDIHTIDFGKYILSYYSKGTAEIMNVNIKELLHGL